MCAITASGPQPNGLRWRDNSRISEREEYKLILKPENMNFSDKNIIMIISGLPGVGKTTLALSAPDVVLIDADGAWPASTRAHRKDAASAKPTKELLSDIKAAEGRYKTIAIDTGGALIELMKDWAMRTEPTANKNGGLFPARVRRGYQERIFENVRRPAQKVQCHFPVPHDKGKNGDEDFFMKLWLKGSTVRWCTSPADLAAILPHHQRRSAILRLSHPRNYNAKRIWHKGLGKRCRVGKDGDPTTFLHEACSRR